MTDRDRLIELVEDGFPENVEIILRETVEAIADYLLANGVIVPPCKVGDIFYGVNETSYDTYCVYGFKWGKRRGDEENVLIILTSYEMEFVWGEEAFLTEEEAEQALKEREKVDR